MADLLQVFGPLLLVFAALFLFALFAWWISKCAERTSVRLFEGLELYPGPAAGLVEVVFHTYSGLLVFVTQREHRFWAHPEQARRALSRMHSFNCTWGLLAYGAAVIPLLSLGNCWAQKRRISKQMRAWTDGHTTDHPEPPA